MSKFTWIIGEKVTKIVHGSLCIKRKSFSTYAGHLQLILNAIKKRTFMNIFFSKLSIIILKSRPKANQDNNPRPAYPLIHKDFGSGRYNVLFLIFS